MIRKSLLTIALLLSLSAASVAQLAIGYMNPTEAVNQMPERDRIESELNAYIAERQERMETKASEFQQQVADYETSKANMTDEQKAAEEQRLTQLEQELQELQVSMQNEIQQKRQELLQPLFDQVNQAIADVAEEMKLDFVLNQSTRSGERVMYYSANDEMDITQKVIAKLLQN